MGFSGGGSNVLKPHKHDGTVIQDGGPLDFDNITQADLTAGDVVYSDGAHLQRLAIGTPAQQIQVNAGATAPEYFTPAGAASTWTTLYDSGNIGIAGNIDSGTFASHPDLYISIYAALSVAAAQGMKFNNDSGNNYQSRDGRDGTWFAGTNQPSVKWTFGTTADWTSSQWWINQRPTADKLITGLATQDVGSGSSPSQCVSSWQWTNNISNITRVEITNGYSGVTSSCQVGSRMIVLGAG